MDPATLATALSLAIRAVAKYKETRDKMIEAGTVTYADETVISNKDLNKLFREDSQKMEAHADELIAKWTK